MIKGLVEQKLTIAGKKYEYPDTTALVSKINELADAVNKLQTKVNKLAPNINFAQPEVKENVQDKFAEQRRWIGKLCKFWDIDNDNLYYGPLTKIHDTSPTSPYCYECNHRICYTNCEPVKDDIIYKGGDNE